MRPHRAGLLAVVLCWVLVGAGNATASNFAVTNVEDSGPDSLRAAMEAANAQAGPDSITISATGVIGLQKPLPGIGDPVEIVGPGEDALTVRRDSDEAFRIFVFAPTAVSLSGMTIENGLAREGGGILSGGPLELTRVRIRGNEARDSGGGANPSALGGGLMSEGELVINESEITGNVAVAAGGTNSAVSLGAGIRVEGKTTIVASTISDNAAEATDFTASAQAAGGGLSSETGKSVRLTGSTVSANFARASGKSSGALVSAAGGGISGEAVAMVGSTIARNGASSNRHEQLAANLNIDGASEIRDTIVSDPIGGGPNCNNELESRGFNLEDGESCGFILPSDHRNAHPGLAPALADNGGPTPTLALLPGSAAIDAGQRSGTITDQRGMPRPSDLLAVPNAVDGDGSDIGAFELQALSTASPPPPVTAPVRDTIAPETRIGKHPPRRGRVRLAVFRFSSSEPGSRFQCKLDRKPFGACSSPFKRKIGPARGARAKHVFMVRAIDAAGNVDQTPAKFVWRVVRSR